MTNYNTSESLYTATELLIMLTFVSDNLSTFLFQLKIELLMMKTINEESPFEVKNNCLILLSNMMCSSIKPDYIGESLFSELQNYFSSIINQPADYPLFVLKATFDLLKKVFEEMQEQNLTKIPQDFIEDVLNCLQSTSKFDVQVLESNLKLIKLFARKPKFIEFFTEKAILWELTKLIGEEYSHEVLCLVLEIFENLFDENYLNEVTI